MTGARGRLLALVLLGAAACERGAPRAEAPEPPELAAPAFRNVAAGTAYVGDSACASCHASETQAYAKRSMAHSFHAWTPAVRTESTLAVPLVHQRTGYRYAVVEDAGRLYQVERLETPDGRRLHELRRRIDWVMGSGRLARTYFTEENGRLFQLPLTWYRERGWDFSPGYEASNPRFSRELPDRCVGCHASYPEPFAHLEGKYAALRPGIGCERCHGPGALHAQERRAGARADTGIDLSIVNPARLPLERRLDVCEQCHVHTAVSVPREGRGDFDYRPSQPLRDQWAHFKQEGAIDVVSHADRLRQSACFVATRRTARPLECATCHDPHLQSTVEARNQPCLSCHETTALAARLPSRARADHAATSDCVRCHMPAVKERDIPHGTFTEHWIAVPGRAGVRAGDDGRDRARIEAYFARDRAGPESAVYLAMGGVVDATLTNDRAALASAAAVLRTALAADTTRADAHFLLGVAFQQLGDGASAIPALERSLRIQAERPEALRALAQSYAYAGRPAASIDSLYERALALQPRLAWMRAEYADQLHAEGERARAIAAYRAAVAEQPSLAVAWFNLGAALAGAGQPRESGEAFRRAVALDPVLDRALGSLARVRVRGDTLLDSGFLPAPIPLLGLAEFARQSVRVRAAPPGGRPAVVVEGVAPRSTVQLLRPDGTVVRTLPAPNGGTVAWDVRAESRALVGGGLYRARVTTRDASGRTLPVSIVPFGIVREDVAP